MPLIGQAVGTAAAACCERRILPRQFAADQKLVSSLQQNLVRQDQWIRTVQNRDRRDLARTAKIRASGESNKGKPELVIDGFDRDIPANKATGARRRLITGTVTP